MKNVRLFSINKAVPEPNSRSAMSWITYPILQLKDIFFFCNSKSSFFQATHFLYCLTVYIVIYVSQKHLCTGNMTPDRVRWELDRNLKVSIQKAKFSQWRILVVTPQKVFMSLSTSLNVLASVCV